MIIFHKINRNKNKCQKWRQLAEVLLKNKKRKLFVVQMAKGP